MVAADLDVGRQPDGEPWRVVPWWHARADAWRAMPPREWGAVVADARRLWLHDVHEFVAGHVGASVGDVFRAGPDTPSLDRVLLRGLMVEPRLRFENMGALVEAVIDVSTEIDLRRARWRFVALALASVALAGLFDRCV